MPTRRNSSREKSAGISPVPTQLEDQVTTVGFTIAGCLELIDKGLEDHSLLGWFFHFPKPGTGGKVKDITMSKLQSRTVDGRKVLTRVPLSAELGSKLIKPKSHTQHARPDFSLSPETPASVSEYQRFPEEMVTLFSGSGYAATDPAIEQLSFYTEWAKAAFFRRTDLEFMRMVLDGQGGVHNDIFFSGSAVDYSTMHNPRYRVMQFTLEDGSVADSSKAFTLKAEPINNKIDGPDLAGPTTFSSNSGSSIGPAPITDQDVPLMIPAVFQAAPCPDYWNRVDGEE